MTLGEAEVQLARGLAPLAAFAAGLVFERVARHAPLRPAWRVNLGLWLIDSVLMALVCGACGFAVAAWAEGAGVGALNLLGAPLAVGSVATILALDAVSYAWHRANHRVGALWRFHRVHHADSDFHVSTALRFHPGELLLALPVRLAAVVVLGAPPAAVVLFEALFGIANVLEHGNFDVPRRLERALERWFITPALHRRHHAAAWSDLDTNFGTILCVWDRLARTLRPDTSAASFATGLPGAVTGACSLPAMVLAPFRRGVRRP
jgi:sterol desaturase/sphingolipid hydroxylase (fatty acid hydroxylase superfamily)